MNVYQLETNYAGVGLSGIMHLLGLVKERLSEKSMQSII
jgi:hypothetical protein